MLNAPLLAGAAFIFPPHTTSSLPAPPRASLLRAIQARALSLARRSRAGGDAPTRGTLHSPPRWLPGRCPAGSRVVLAGGRSGCRDVPAWARPSSVSSRRDESESRDENGQAPSSANRDECDLP